MAIEHEHAALGHRPIHLTVSGEMQLPNLYLGYRTAVSLARPITARIALVNGQLRIDNLDYSDTTTVVELTPEQQDQLFDGLVSRAAPTVTVLVIEEEVQTPDDQPWNQQHALTEGAN